MTLQDQLREILAREGILPPDPDDAILGSELLARVREHLSAPYSANSIRQTFSVLAGDPTSPIARVAQGFGYYRRPISSVQVPISDQPDDTRQPSAPPVPTVGGRDVQPEEKFRAFFLRHARLRSGFPVRVEHTAGSHQPAGVNKWKFPDVVVLDWEVGDQSEDGFVLDRALLESVRKSVFLDEFV